MAVEAAVIADPVALDRAVQKVSRRLLWFLLLMYIFAHLDRVNVGFAALSMNRDLLLTATAFGFSATIFNIAYFLCEIPSNLLLVRYGAKIWIARIMITWGIASAATMLATGATSLYVLRFLVGAAEGGFLPGVILYLTYWFPQRNRARATAIFMAAQPIAIAFGAPISGLILQYMNGVQGLAGWRWLFLIEGLPSIIIGIAAYFYLTDNPRVATWLTPPEKAALQQALDAEKPAASSKPSHSLVWRQLIRRDVLLLAMTYFGLVLTLNTITTWVPQIVREVFAGWSLSYTGLFNGIPAVCAAIAMPLWSARSDRRGERTWHIVAPMALAATGWILVALSVTPEVRFLGLVFSTVGAFTSMCLFWTFSSTILSPETRPAGIAFISSIGILAAISGPVVIGRIRDLTNSFTWGLMWVAVMMLASAALVILISLKIAAPAPQRP